VCFGTHSLALRACIWVIEPQDAELVRNVFNGLPIHYAMLVGKSDLGTGVQKTLATSSYLPSR